MTTASMTICQDDQERQVQLNPAGTLIGRCEPCEVVIPSPHISRNHARIFWNAAGTWVVEDLGSSNGTFVNGQRVESCSISSADVIEIGPASLVFSAESRRIPVLCTLSAPNVIIEDFGTEVFYDEPQLAKCDRQPCPERLAQVSQRLSELTTETAVYPEVCRLLAQAPKTAGAVVRMQKTTSSPPAAPEVLACHFGTRREDARAGSRGHPSHLAFRVSHRLLEAVRDQGRALMTKSIFSCDTEVTLSVIDEHSPQALMCACLNTGDDTVDLLYADVPIDERRQPGPEEMFAFVQAVARLVMQGSGPQENTI